MPNDDYIKRGDALFELHNYASGNDPSLIIAYRVNLCERIENIPAADVEPVRHGRTIDDMYLSYEIYVCSVCKAFYPKEMEYFGKQHFKYCPNCGAKMDKEEA